MTPLQASAATPPSRASRCPIRLDRPGESTAGKPSGLTASIRSRTFLVFSPSLLPCYLSGNHSEEQQELVEAAGIEPASESTPSGRPTCLARALCRPGADHGHPAPGPLPE